MSTETAPEIGIIETFAGNGKSRSTGDGKRAIKAGIPLPNQVTLDRLNLHSFPTRRSSDHRKSVV